MPYKKGSTSPFSLEGITRPITILVLCLTLVAGCLVSDVRVNTSAHTIDQTKHPVLPKAEEGFLPPYLLERAALYSRLHHPDVIFITTAPKASTDQHWFASLLNARVSIYDAKNTRNLPGFGARLENASPVSDSAVNNAYDYHMAMRSFLKKVFNRNSIDDKGMDVVGTVHYGSQYDNAFWNGQQMVYGDGDGDLFDSFVLLDVVGHELFHGVTENTSKLDYEGQSGALNEHLSDVFGVLLRQWRKDLSVKKDSWLVGPGLFSSKVNGRALRDMLHPGTAYNDSFLGKDTQPSNMKDYVQTDEDSGGVHSNSGIPNRAFALFARAVGGKAWKTAGHVWFEVATGGHIPSNCDFQTFANATVDECTKQAPEAVAKLKAAWAAVGIKVD